MLAEKFIQKARVELREEENRKKQALEHFREWIRKHPYIKKIRQGINRTSLLINFNQLMPINFLCLQMTRFCFSSCELRNTQWTWRFDRSKTTI